MSHPPATLSRVRSPQGGGWPDTPPGRGGTSKMTESLVQLGSPADTLRRRLPVRFPPGDNRVAEHADLLDLSLHHIAGLEVQRGGVLTEAGDARHGPGRDDVARAVTEGGVVRQDLRDRHAHVSGVRALPRFAVDAQLHREIVRVTDLLGSDDPRPQRAEGVDRLAEREDARLHLAALDVPGGDVVEDHVPADVVIGLVGPEPAPRFADDDRELELIVELLGQVLRIHDGLVRADDRVDVLEKDDPRCDPVRPADALRLLLVLAEVPGRVEELLRDDRRAQPHVLDGMLAGRARNLVALEILAHRAGVALDDTVALDPPAL